MSSQLSRTLVGKDGCYKLYIGVLSLGSLKHILSGCKTSLTQGYMWRRNQVLKSLVWLFENKRTEVNSLLINDRDSRISYLQEKWAEKYTPGTYKQHWQMG